MTDALQQLGWKPIEEAPKFVQLLLFREDAGIFLGEYGCLAEMLKEDEVESSDLDDDIMWSNDWWTHEIHGTCRLESDLAPTKYMHLSNIHRMVQVIEVLTAQMQKFARAERVIEQPGEAIEALRKAILFRHPPSFVAR